MKHNRTFSLLLVAGMLAGTSGNLFAQTQGAVPIEQLALVQEQATAGAESMSPDHHHGHHHHGHHHHHHGHHHHWNSSMMAPTGATLPTPQIELETK